MCVANCKTGFGSICGRQTVTGDTCWQLACHLPLIILTIMPQLMLQRTLVVILLLTVGLEVSLCALRNFVCSGKKLVPQSVNGVGHLKANIKLTGVEEERERRRWRNEGVEE